jgi:hypothetical protein
MDSTPKRANPRSLKRELSRRCCAGLDVTLYWRERTGGLSLAVRDAGNGDSFEVDVDPADALDAFEHPYSYAARLGVPFARPPANRLVAHG